MEQRAGKEGETVSSPEQDTTWSSFCPQWRPPPHRPLCRTDPHSDADRSPLLHWRRKTTLLLDCGGKTGWFTQQTALYKKRYGEHVGARIYFLLHPSLLADSVQFIHNLVSAVASES